MDGRSIMDHTIVKIGLPVKCAFGDCETVGRVKPKDYAGWYKCKMLRMRWKKQWFCPEHYEKGRELDNRFYDNYKTPQPYTDAELKSQEQTTEELYKLLD